MTVTIPLPSRETIRKVGTRVGVLILAITILSAGFVVVRPVVLPTQQEVWFQRMMDLAVRADAAYDLITEPAEQPKTNDELLALMREIVYQIEEEGATDQLIGAPIGFADFGPGRRSGVAGYYSHQGYIMLNERYLLPAWGNQSWLGVLVHELVHAQGYFVGESSVLEAQTEATATEVLAAMANLNYPGARADLLDGLRRDALSMAFFIANWGGGPIDSTYADIPEPGQANEGMLERWEEVRAQVFTPTELARAEHRLRWWLSQPDNEYYGVLGRYVVKVVTVLYSGACSESETLSEPFERHRLGVLGWLDPVEVGPLAVDDLAYILKNELEVC